MILLLVAPKKNTSVNCSSVLNMVAGLQVYSCYVNDTNDAPMTGLSFDISGLNLNDSKITFNESNLPITNAIINLVSVNVTYLEPGNHTLIVTAINQLGKTEIINETTCIQGKCTIIILIII